MGIEPNPLRIIAGLSTGIEANPLRIIAGVTTLGASESIIQTAQVAGKILPIPTSCCGCPTVFHRELIGSGNVYHCTRCDRHCGHIGTIAWRYCHICRKDVKFY